MVEIFTVTDAVAAFAPVKLGLVQVAVNVVVAVSLAVAAVPEVPDAPVRPGIVQACALVDVQLTFTELLANRLVSLALIATVGAPHAQLTKILLTGALVTVPEPFVTVQVWDGELGWALTVTA